MENKILDDSYKVVVNAEEQYALWPLHLHNPSGWSNAGKSGTKAECLTFVNEVWCDLTPLSLRQV
ncbi:MAG: MbtH family NRPS accessory protein [Candidatus Pristimantibacillus lignocellulolyticus]|uniref:MbtH family NRPS accessory protein n=1 Tax=Candidatus Pristimantibacillus lignocellulolyticus TaxID=2994561 RepID=A0A9J6ZCP3_9BACL|nr:MAG: MbtH family NRPS accessory protein [Candidatus Pristimantibacillus lignocellulolyticus]